MNLYHHQGVFYKQEYAMNQITKSRLNYLVMRIINNFIFNPKTFLLNQLSHQNAKCMYVAHPLIWFSKILFCPSC